jgi:hypothetical protein
MAHRALRQTARLRGRSQAPVLAVRCVDIRSLGCLPYVGRRAGLRHDRPTAKQPVALGLRSAVFGVEGV